MIEQPYNCGKIEVSDAGYKGWGIIATDSIKSGEVVEVCPFILFPRYYNLAKPIYDTMKSLGFIAEKEKYIDNLRANLKHKLPEQHFFKWHPKVGLENDAMYFLCTVLGYGSLYNSSNTKNNIGWKINEYTFTFTAEKDINKGDWLESFYGYYVCENGNTYNCNQVFNLALDPDETGKIKCKMIRFGDLSDFEAAKTNPSFTRVSQLFALDPSGLFISKLTGLVGNGEERALWNFAPDAPMSIFYQKLNECKNSNFPAIKIDFQYQKDGQTLTESIPFRK